MLTPYVKAVPEVYTFSSQGTKKAKKLFSTGLDGILKLLPVVKKKKKGL